MSTQSEWEKFVTGTWDKIKDVLDEQNFLEIMNEVD